MSNLSEYKQSMESLRFTPQQKSALAAAAAGAAARQTRRARRPLGRTAAIAACLAAVLAVSAGAAGVLKSAAESLAPLFGGAAARTEVIDKIGRPIGASDSGGGLTITADAIIGDRYNACVIYTIRRDDGAPFEFEPNEWGYLGLCFRDGWIDISGTGGAYHGASGFIDPTPGDDSIQYFQQISSDVPLNAGTATASFKDLFAYEDFAGGETPLADGKWKLRFEMDYEDSAIYLGGGETFSQDGLTFTVDEISVSPIAVRVAYTVDGVMALSGSLENGRMPEADARESARFMENVEILLTKADGTVIDLSDAGGSGGCDADDNVSHFTKGRILDEIVPLEELESISVGGVVYPISAK